MVLREQTEADPQKISPRMIATEVRQQVGFLTLPREIRDHIHLNLIAVEHPVQDDTQIKSLSRSNTFTDRAILWMFEVASNTQIAREARETFYQHNTFLIYTHDIPTLFSAKVHTVSFGATDGVEPATHSTPLEAGAWVRKLAVRVGWHGSGGWFPDECCRNPARDLRTLLKSDGLRSVIVAAKFGAWSYGYPQNIGWDLLEEMNEKRGKESKI